MEGTGEDGGENLGRSGVVGIGREFGRGCLGLAVLEEGLKIEIALAGPGKASPVKVLVGAWGSGLAREFLVACEVSFVLGAGVSITLV